MEERAIKKDSLNGHLELQESRRKTLAPKAQG